MLVGAVFGKEEEQFAFSCLRCKAMTRCSKTIVVPGDDSATTLSLGQRERVYCPICGDMKDAEFILVTHQNVARLVDAAGNPIGQQLAAQYQMQAAQMPNMAMGAPPSPAGALGVAPASAVAGFGAPPLSPQPPLPTGNCGAGPIPGNVMVPSPIGGQAPSPTLGGTAAMMAPADFDRHIASLTDDQVHALRTDLQGKIAKIEGALIERRRCVICCDREKSVVCLPCKHMATCKQCSDKISECPLCKSKITDRILPFTA